MFNEKKKLIEYLNNENRELRELLYDFKRTEHIEKKRYDNLQTLLKENFTYQFLDFFLKEYSEHAVIYRYSKGYGKEFGIFDLGLGKYKCKADIGFNTKELKIINLDASPFHKGFGSLCLKYIEQFAYSLNIHRIYGMLMNSTPIGLNNLIHFYEKNGYTVSEKDRGYLYFEKNI
ncbi:MAG: hypothetical protein J1E39_03645 [Eubacterium sp.]|nr:hypothetical protein [Eubacterium sp.]